MQMYAYVLGISKKECVVWVDNLMTPLKSNETQPSQLTIDIDTVDGRKKTAPPWDV